MKYRIETWTVENLLDSYQKGALDLNPSYQRRFIWSIKDQQTLIDSMVKGYAIPNIFVLEKGNGKFEMVDGQQRTRTILGFVSEQFKTFEGKLYSKKDFKKLQSYQIAVIVIEKMGKDENIEDFYSLVNKAGVHLNRPELKKAEFFETKFLKLVTDLAEDQNFKDLDLFTETTSKRMVDVDFVAELVTLLMEGNTDKKIAVDRKFEKDINQTDYIRYAKEFRAIVDTLTKLDEIHPIKKTRYKQRNDFYTLFGFFKNDGIKRVETYKYFYKLLLKFNDDITPSNSKCPPFQNYAFHCISQSNSKAARDARTKIFEQIFLNKKNVPNKIQKDIIKFYTGDITNVSLVKKEDFFTIDLSKL